MLHSYYYERFINHLFVYGPLAEPHWSISWYFLFAPTGTITGTAVVVIRSKELPGFWTIGFPVAGLAGGFALEDATAVLCGSCFGTVYPGSIRDGTAFLTNRL